MSTATRLSRACLTVDSSNTLPVHDSFGKIWLLDEAITMDLNVIIGLWHA